MLKYQLFRIGYTKLVKPIFFRFDPERVHDFVSQLGILLGSIALTRHGTRRLLRYDHPALSQTICGIKFPNPVGLSAGFDKDAKLLQILPAAGFGFAEIGSVTWGSYQGNPRPRLFRLPRSAGLVVYYGLKSGGVQPFIKRVKQFSQPDFPLNVSVAKTNCERTADERNGIKDYCQCLKELTERNAGDFYTINISCPNTFGGEPFTTPLRLEHLLSEVAKLNITKPLFVKMPINLLWPEFQKLLDICVKYGVTGVTIGNLTKVRDNELIKDPLPDAIKGGISGKPTEQLSNDLIRETYRHYRDKLLIIGVGGIFSPSDAYQKIKLGASLVELITGMIFQGPGLIGEINAGLTKLLVKDGYTSISQAVGADLR